MRTFSRGFASYKPPRKPTLTIPSTCARRAKRAIRGVKLFMIISDSIVNKLILHSVPYSSAKRFGSLLYMCTFKIRGNARRNLRQIASNVFYFLRCGILIELLTWEVQMPRINSFNSSSLHVQYAVAVSGRKGKPMLISYVIPTSNTLFIIK